MLTIFNLKRLRHKTSDSTVDRSTEIDTSEVKKEWYTKS